MYVFRVAILLLLGVLNCFAFPLLNKNITQGDIRVPVILVQFEDVKFSSEEPKSYYMDFLNKEGFNENDNVGSIRDYFIYNSMGAFRPYFDVLGPITLPNVKEFYDTSNTSNWVSQVIDSLLSQNTDFSIYDNDGDGSIEFFPILYAGKPCESISCKLWPSKITKELKIGENLLLHQYFYSDEEGEMGTFIHEFNHILGFPDLYVPINIHIVGSWSVMDDTKRIPPLYSSVDRMLMGWLTPIELDGSDSLRLNKLDDNEAYVVINPENENEMYLLEYRTKKNWDFLQPNSGMLIWYVDYDDSAWTTQVNNYGCNAREYVVRAKITCVIGYVSGETCSYGAGLATGSDVFPGIKNVTNFDGFIFRNGLNMNITLSEITESEDKSYATFKVTKSTPYMTEIESSSSNESEITYLSFSERTEFSNDPSSFAALVPISSLDSLEFIAKTEKQRFQTQVAMLKNSLHVQTSAQGSKDVRLFSLNGHLLYESEMDGPEKTFVLPKHIGAQKMILLISQGKINLYNAIVTHQ